MLANKSMFYGEFLKKNSGSADLISSGALAANALPPFVSSLVFGTTREPLPEDLHVINGQGRGSERGRKDR